MLKNHISQNEKFEIDDIEIAMLANEYDLYFSNLEFCQKHGYSFQTGSNNGYSQIRPEFSVMKNAYQNILKHSGKFGITPADRAKLFGEKIGKAQKPMEFDI
jgi:phage terminase small subunit